MEYPSSWNNEAKQQLINDIDFMIKAKPCIQKATNMAELGQCM
jgi:hypothetical protein